MSNADRRDSSRQSQGIDENLYYEEEPEYALPRNGLTRAIVIGLVGGLVALAVSIGIVVSNAALFNEGARLGNNMPIDVASHISSLSLIGVAVDIVVAFVVGIIVGKVAVKRWWGFVAGVVVGVVIQLGIFLAQYIPGYPGIIHGGTNTSNIIQQILGLIIAIFFYALFGGLLSLWGTAIMTRKHPYYLSRRQKARIKE